MGGFFDWWGGGSSNSSTQTQLNKLQKEIDAIKTNISLKVDKVIGKGLSTNDFTDEYKNKVDNFTGGTVNVVENNVEVDATLTKDGCAADAKVTGERFENIIKDLGKVEHSVIQSVKEYIKGLNLNTSTGETGTATVNNTDYVTPQMFGAKANGWTDDTDAIQKAIDSGKSVFFPCGEYMISKPLVITDKKFWSLNAQDAVITYTGDDYAIHILNATNLRINIGMVYALQGGGIKFYSDSKNSWNQYNELTFNAIFAKTDCIHIETSGEGWSNENRVFGGHFASGENGVNVVSRSIHTINGWKFYNCGIEGVTNGFMFDATVEEIGAICNMAIVNSRYAEKFETMLKTNGTVFDCLWIAPTYMTKNLIQCSPQTTRFMFYCPIGTFWHMHDTAYVRGAIIDGKLMGERPEYKTIE